jgi:hypothetical protein
MNIFKTITGALVILALFITTLGRAQPTDGRGIALTQTPATTNVVALDEQQLSFSVAADAPALPPGLPLNYRWQFNGANQVGITSNFTLRARTSGVVTAIVYGNAGTNRATWQVTVRTNVNVRNDLLLIYNTNSAASGRVLRYYLTHRPGIRGANILGVGYVNPVVSSNVETISPLDLTNRIFDPLHKWLQTHPTKRPQYVLLLFDLPSRVNTNLVSYQDHGPASVQCQIAFNCVPGWRPFVTSLNLDTEADCIGYIDKLAALGKLIVPGTPLLSAAAKGYGNTDWYFDDANSIYNTKLGMQGLQGVSSNGVPTSAVHYAEHKATHIYSATNVAGYYTGGNDSGLGIGYSLRAVEQGANPVPQVQFHGASGWYVMESIDSYDGRGGLYGCSYGGWFSPNAFGGSNYSNTPVGAVSTVDEPFLAGKNNTYIFFSLWQTGKNFAICAWNSENSPYFQAVGDPFLVK